MKLLIANTYTAGYGVELTLFGTFNTEEECISKMKDYNTNIVPVLELALADYKKLWDKNCSSEEDYNDREATERSLYKTLETYGIHDPLMINKIFKFNLSKPERYIKDFDNTHPIYLGGYTE